MIIYLDNKAIHSDTEAMEALHGTDWSVIHTIEFDIRPIMHSMVMLDSTEDVELWADDTNYYYLEKEHVKSI